MTTWDREKMREWMRNRRRQRKDAKECTMCGSYKAIPGYVVCQKCLDRQNTYYKKSGESRQ